MDLGPEAHNNLKSAWNKGFQGAGNKHRVAILGGDLSWEAIGVSPEDSQLIESQKFSVVEIARIFRVPLNLVQDYERSTYSNVLEQNRSFLTHTLTPYLERIEQGMERALLTESEKGRFFIEHLTAGLLRADTKQRYESYEIARRAGFLSVNEIRSFESMNGIGAQGDKYDPIKQPAPVPNRTRAKKKVNTIDDRDRIRAEYLPKLKAAAADLVSIEVEGVRKVMAQRDPLAVALESFYQKFEPVVAERMGPVFAEYGARVKGALKDALGAGEAAGDDFLTEGISAYARSHVLSSVNQLEALISDDGPDAIDTRLDEWMEKRPDKISSDQAVKLAEGLFAAMAFGSGYKIMSNARGKSCPFCKSIDGKIIGRGGVMVEPGPWTVAGQVMKMRQPKISPAYHRGCLCFLTHV